LAHDTPSAGSGRPGTLRLGGDWTGTSVDVILIFA
jgi:hypothetical protein